MSTETDILTKELREFSETLKRDIRQAEKRHKECLAEASDLTDSTDRYLRRSVANYHRDQAEILRGVLTNFSEQFSDYDNFAFQGEIQS